MSQPSQPSQPSGKGESLPRLVEIMQRLLAPGGCPWDREQDLSSLRPFVIEEAFEVVDAIDAGSPELLKEELGDLLLQIVFQSELARREGWFGPDDVVAAICDKMIRRHPHVFGSDEVEGSEEVLHRWEKIKAEERRKEGKTGGALGGVPKALPALLRAVRVGEKAARVGYDWADAEGARAKIEEELEELDRAVEEGDEEAIERELGDLLFALASFARKRKLDPEAALRGSLDRFSDRFGVVERSAKERGLVLDELDEEALDALWREAKRELLQRPEG